MNLDTLYNSIKGGTCILILGPDLVVRENEADGFFEHFIKYCAKQNKDVQSFYSDDGFFNIPQGSDLDSLKLDLFKFFNQCSSRYNPLYEKIAQIPFHLIFMVSPDNCLQKWYQTKGYPHQAYSYHPKESKDQWAIDKVDKNEPPLLINLLLDYNSEIEHVRDYILTYEDFIAFIAYFYRNNPFPVPVLSAIKAAKDIIFLGYRFDKWYWKLIFELFNFPEPCYADERKVRKANFAILNTPPASWNSNKNFYEKQYNTVFENLSAKSFINHLYKKFKKNELRKPIHHVAAETAKDWAEEIIVFCKKSEMNRAFKKIDEYAKYVELDANIKTTIIEIIGDFHNVKKQYAGRERAPEIEFDLELGIPSSKEKDLRRRILELMNLISSM